MIKEKINSALKKQKTPSQLAGVIIKDVQEQSLAISLIIVTY